MALRARRVTFRDDGLQWVCVDVRRTSQTSDSRRLALSQQLLRPYPRLRARCCRCLEGKMRCCLRSPSPVLYLLVATPCAPAVAPAHVCLLATGSAAVAAGGVFRVRRRATTGGALACGPLAARLGRGPDAESYLAFPTSSLPKISARTSQADGSRWCCIALRRPCSAAQLDFSKATKAVHLVDEVLRSPMLEVGTLTQAYEEQAVEIGCPR